MNGGFEHQALCVDEHVALTPLDLLGPIIASFATHPGGFDALTVDNTRAGLGVSSQRDPDVLAQTGIQLFPEPRLPPRPPVMIRDGPRRQVVGNGAPLTARADHIKDGITNRPEGIRAWSAQPRWQWEQGLQDPPFFLGHVTRIRRRSHLEILSGPSPFAYFFDSFLEKGGAL